MNIEGKEIVFVRKGGDEKADHLAFPDHMSPKKKFEHDEPLPGGYVRAEEMETVEAYRGPDGIVKVPLRVADDKGVFHTIFPWEDQYEEKFAQHEAREAERSGVKREQRASGTVIQMPSMPGAPEMPGMPGAPEMPGMPGAPQMPSMPGAPEMPGWPGAPQTPSMPGAPEMPGMPSMAWGAGAEGAAPTSEGAGQPPSPQQPGVVPVQQQQTGVVPLQQQPGVVPAQQQAGVVPVLERSDYRKFFCREIIFISRTYFRSCFSVGESCFLVLKFRSFCV